ncbi:50S ribosomal protein L5 [candidate division WWE3 bacterium RIFCSPLOWO2_01_FULL_39_13]|uniref:Large ribosomal subunit protein uL5 n=1 Tax=candidate division WWE3 bacterium RIFCSPLOWO2_01_FULL_39_13 TaxID=1802624 RepID=A0A1F4V4M7_UNCKA|nr:MAG: 50S ribosomal protein L5 [candidate division WWE3 bacterium RIFCSPLOWO2_01_FULL_39_13]
MSIKDDFYNKIINDLKKELKVSSKMAVPTVKKIVVNVGVGKNRENKKFMEEVVGDIKAITGQKPSARRAKKSISNFKLRKGQLTGYTVTLRGRRMWDFYEKLVKIVFPRVKDFRGLKKDSFDGSGNYSIGVNDHTVFPEIDPNSITYAKTLEITINTSANDNNSGFKLLSALEMPFRK